MDNGARIFNIQDAIDKEPFKIFRLPGLGKIRRNDVLVFNYPYASHTDSIAMDVLLYYVKRCIASRGYIGNKERLLSDTWSGR